MAGRTLYARFVEDGTQGLIALHEDAAPVTVDTIWTALARPIRTTAMHAMFAGPEIMMGLPPEAQTFDPRGLPPENQTCFPEPGDLLWFYQAPNLMKGLNDELWELGLFYGKGGRIFGPLGWTPCTIFGCMTEGLDAFAAACGKTRTEGVKVVEIGRHG
ncbi:MAG: DUF3830 family protein [Alphaproteobacteria bacterium]